MLVVCSYFPVGSLTQKATNKLNKPSIIRTHVAIDTTTKIEAPYKQGGWSGVDEFSTLEDRIDAAPLPLPQLKRAVRVCLVRHGQSTWNAEGRIQGSSNESVLTEKGVAQAITAKEMLKTERFDAMFVSPLVRSSKTGEIIWSNRDGPVKQIPHLREIDLYSFQGLLKHEGKERFGNLYKDWQTQAHQFEIDNHAPVRELWYRASVAWNAVFQQYEQLSEEDSQEGCLLVVAHNAVNQAMIAAAVGLPPTFFRRILQSNAASSVLDFQPPQNGTTSGPRVTIDRLNQSPAPPFASDGAGRKAQGRVILVRSAATYNSEDGILLGRKDENCSTLGEVQSYKTGELLMDAEVNFILSSPLLRAKEVAVQISKLQQLVRNGSEPVQVEYSQELLSMELGDWQGRLAREVRGQPIPADAEPLEDVMERTKKQWQKILELAAQEDGKNVVVVSHWNVHSAFICHVLGLGQSFCATFRMDPGGVTVIDFPDGPLNGDGVIRCMNYTAHLGRWSVPINRDDLDTVCGIDGCF